MSLQEHEISLQSICFALFVANYIYKKTVPLKNIDLFISVFKKIIPSKATATFQ